MLSQSTPFPQVRPSDRTAGVDRRAEADPEARVRILGSYGKLPLSFEPNQGQADGRVQFESHTSGYSLFLTPDEAVLILSGKKLSGKKLGGKKIEESSAAENKNSPALRMKLRNANPPPAQVMGMEELAGTSNYFVGNNPAKWRTNVPTYAKVRYESIYSGIDLVYYGTGGQLEYDFILAPGADPRRIAFDIKGADRIRRDALGDLILTMGRDEIRWHKPVAFQEKDGARQEIAAHYAIADKSVTFELAKYDSSLPLYIDPLIYSTFLGGFGYDAGFGIAVDSEGNAYITGTTTSTDFPTTSPLQSANGGGPQDAFVTKLNAFGSALVYSTYLGGNGFDGAGAIVVDGAGNAYVAGSTNSTDFPTMNPLQLANGGGFDGFLVKLNPAGSALLYSTYLGGSADDSVSAIALAQDNSGDIYIAGETSSTDFPTMNPIQPSYGGGSSDAFVAKINKAGSALLYSTYLGGSGTPGGDIGSGIAVDKDGNAYVTGATNSTDFPTKNPLQPAFGGGLQDAFVTKINASGTSLVYSTYLGGSGAGNESGYGIAVDGEGNAYVTGATSSSNFPTMNPLQPNFGGGQFDGFVAKLNSSGSALVYSTYLGGQSSDAGTAIAVDSNGVAYITGSTESKNFPTKYALQPALNMTEDDAFVAKLNAAGSALLYSTYLGGKEFDYGNGIAIDGMGNAYVVGTTTSKTKFPTQNPLQAALHGPQDAFVAKIDLRANTTTTIMSSLNPSTFGQAVIFTATVTSAAGTAPDGESVSFMKGTTALGVGTLSGGSATFTTSTLPGGTSPVTAVYGGDVTFPGSTSQPLKQVVNKATTTTSVGSSLNPSNFGQSVTFTASVVPEFGGAVTGKITFYDGTTVLKSMQVTGGTAKFTTKTLTRGAHNVTATYNGSVSLDGSSSAVLTQTVN